MELDSLSNFFLFYARKGLLKFLRKSCYRKFCRRNKGVDILTTTHFGSVMKVTIGDSVDNEIYINKYFEIGTSKLMVKLSHKSNCFVDVGCNIGYFSCLFAKLNPQAAIYSIEPNPETIDRAKENLELNGIVNFVTFNCGVSLKNDNMKFYVPKKRHSLASFIKPENYQEDTAVIEVEVRPLMDILHDKQIDNAVLKVDVEGFEYNVLSGLTPSDARKFSYIIFEFASDHFKNAGISEREIFTIPWFRDYDVYSITEGGSLKPFTYHDNRQYSQNLCLARKGLCVD